MFHAHLGALITCCLVRLEYQNADTLLGVHVHVQLGALKQHAAELQQQADNATDALAAAPAAAELAAAQTAVLETQQQAQRAAAERDTLQQRLKALQRDQEVLQRRLVNAEQRLATVAQGQPSTDSAQTNGGFDGVADGPHSSAHDGLQLANGTPDADRQGTHPLAL